jgi:hypothetical protein
MAKHTNHVTRTVRPRIESARFPLSGLLRRAGYYVPDAVLQRDNLLLELNLRRQRLHAEVVAAERAHDRRERRELLDDVIAGNVVLGGQP